jgi:hypothetical protein
MTRIQGESKYPVTGVVAVPGGVTPHGLHQPIFQFSIVKVVPIVLALYT